MTVVRPLELLHDAPVPIHLMAEQEYCEVKVDLRLRHPEAVQQFPIISELSAYVAKLGYGAQFHEAMREPAEPLELEDVDKFISSGQPFTLVETLLNGTYNQLNLAGRPDALHFESNGRAWVIEHKVRDHSYPTPSDDVQLRLYGYLLLRDRRFRVRDLTLVCSFATPEVANRVNVLPRDDRASLLAKLSTASGKSIGMHRKLTEHVLPDEPDLRVVAVSFPYDPDKVISELRFLADYWLGRRAPIPTLKHKKCASCPFNFLAMCPSALAPFGATT